MKNDCIFASGSASSLPLNSTTKNTSSQFSYSFSIYLSSISKTNIKENPHLKNLKGIATSNLSPFLKPPICYKNSDKLETFEEEAFIKLNRYLHLGNTNSKHRSKRIQQLFNTLTSKLTKEISKNTKSRIQIKRENKKQQTNSLRRLPNSRTFPMSRNDVKNFSLNDQKSPPEEEFNEDFVPYSYAAKESQVNNFLIFTFSKFF